MLRLLHNFLQPGYPGDYLLARIRCRKAALSAEDFTGDEENISDVSDAEVWNRDKEERQWLFGQMNHALRRATAPVFFYFEINTLIQCLRSMEAGRFEVIEPLVARTLLSADLKNILLTKASAQEAVGRLEHVLHDSPLPVRGLSDVYKEKGIQGCEEMVRTNFFLQALRSGVNQETYSFIQSFNDLRNTLTMAKCQRWSREVTPQMVKVGETGPKLFSLRVTEDRLQRRAGHFTGGREILARQLHPISLEPVLDNALLQQLSRDRRIGRQVAACIEYLLYIHFVSRNRSVLLHTKQRGMENGIEKEMVH